MSQFTFFADVLSALGGAIEKDKKKTKPEVQIPLRPEVSEMPQGVPEMLQIPKSDLQQDIELGIVDRNINMPIEEMVAPAIQQQVPNIAAPSIDSAPEPPELLRRVPQYERRFDDPKAGIVQPDGRISTHQMASEVDPETGLMTAFPMVVKMPDGSLKQFEDRAEALKYNKSINNVRTFYNDQDGIDYAAGGYKEGTALADLTPVQQFNQQFGGVPNLQIPPTVKPVRYQVPPQTKPDVSGQLFDKNTTRGEGQSQFDADVQKATSGMNADVLYDRAIAPLVFGGLPDKGGMKAVPVPGTSFVNRAYGYFTDSKEEEAARDVAEKAREYFNNDSVRQRIINDPEALYMLGKDPIGYYKALTSNKVEEFKSDLPVAFEPGVPEVTTTGVPAVSAPPVAQDTTSQDTTGQDTTTQVTTSQGTTATQQQVDASNQAAADPNNQEAKSGIDAAVDDVVSQEDFPRLMPGEGSSQQTLEETFNQEVLDNKGNVVKDPKQSFLSKLWDGVKDVIVTQVQDPVNQKALFAYAVSRALGYDGVTLASQVLSNEWKQQAATTKHERELERLYGKEKMAQLKKQRENATINYSKPVTVYDPKKNQNFTIYLSKDNQQFRFGDGGTENYSLGALLKKGYTIGEGVDFEDHQKALGELMISDAQDLTKSILDGIEDTTQRTAVANKIGNAIAPRNIRKAVVAFTNKFGRSTDYNSLAIQNMVDAGIENFVRAVADGRAEGSKDLIGYMDYEHLKYDITKTNIPEAFFAIPGEEGQLIGVNGWSRTNEVVKKIANNINSRLGKGSYTEADIYSVLSDEFFGKYKDGGNPFAKHWDGAADNIVGNKAEAVSPAMLWIQGITSGQDVSPDYKSPSLKEVVDMLAARKKS